MYNLRPIQILMAAMLALAPAPALAYIDPNAGGMLFQILTPLLTIIGGIFVFMRGAMLHAVGQIWERLRALASLRR